jgi:serine/threonine-protein kinase
MPVPPGGAVEGEQGYACTQGGDCHLLVIDDAHQKLYEMWEANQVSATSWQGGCQVVWDMTKLYPANLRGDQCTSADAAGFPISALLFTADEVAAGQIDHAIRFILPNGSIRHGSYLHPATHSTNPTAGGPNAPPYGVHLRLRADYPVSSLPAGAQVVARALQKYGMLLADGGQIALTAADDRFSTAKWANLLGPRDLSALQVSDFEVVTHDAPIDYTGNCVRNP